MTPIFRSEQRFSVLLDDPAFAFNASHFVAFPPQSAENDATAPPRWLGEPIHGHDFRAVARVEGPLDASGCVVDFLAALRAARDVVSDWNHRLFLARKTPCVEYDFDENSPEIEIVWNGAPSRRRWIFPRDAVVWLDSVNASAEAIAAATLDAWIERLVALRALSFPVETSYRFSLRLTEAPGSVAEVVLEPKVSFD